MEPKSALVKAWRGQASERLQRMRRPAAVVDGTAGPADDALVGGWPEHDDTTAAEADPPAGDPADDAPPPRVAPARKGRSQNGETVQDSDDRKLTIIDRRKAQGQLLKANQGIDFLFKHLAQLMARHNAP